MRGLSSDLSRDFNERLNQNLKGMAADFGQDVSGLSKYDMMMTVGAAGGHDQHFSSDDLISYSFSDTDKESVDPFSNVKIMGLSDFDDDFMDSNNLNYFGVSDDNDVGSQPDPSINMLVL